MDWIDFLRKNKPVLEILLAVAGLIATTLLSIMAITLTRAANRIAAANLRVAERQTTLAEIQLQPSFRFELERTSDELGSYDRLRMFNDGAPIEALSVQQAVFLELNLPESQPGGGSSGRRAIPVYYFGNREYTGQRTGLLATLSSLWSPHFGFNDRNATSEVAELTKNLGGPREYIYARTQIFLMIDYADASGNSHVVTYEINPEWSLHSPALPRVLRGEERRRHIQWLFNMRGVVPENLETLTPESVIERWEEYPKPEDLW